MTFVLFLLTCCGGVPQSESYSARPQTLPDAQSGAVAHSDIKLTSTTPLNDHFSEILRAHNELREAHCAPVLQWSEKLAHFAQTWADTLKQRGCRIEHRENSPFGENLSFFAPPDSRTSASVAHGWHSEVQQYDFSSPRFSMQTGHFTQVVWQETRFLGCGVSECDGGLLWVCNYDPPGNVQGQYAKQVLPKTCNR